MSDQPGSAGIPLAFLCLIGARLQESPLHCVVRPRLASVHLGCARSPDLAPSTPPPNSRMRQVRGPSVDLPLVSLGWSERRSVRWPKGRAGAEWVAAVQEET